MLSYESASKIPPSEGLLIIDAIDNRDMIIDKLLEKINTKFDGLVQENEKLKKTISDMSTHDARVIMMGSTSVPPGMVSSACAEKTNPSHIVRRGSDGSVQVVLTEATQKGYELCRPFSSRNYTKYHPHRPFDGNVESYMNLYKEIHKIMVQEGKKIVLQGSHSLKPPKDLDPKTAMDIDGVEKVWYDYGLFTQKKKYLSALIGIVTDYVSDMVYVEKVLERLDIIVNDMNKDKELLKIIFAGKLEPGEIGKIAIIFKGGNVYKLFTQVLDKQLDASVFRNYLTDVDRYFKKSDCDFGILLLKYPKENQAKKTVIHLQKNTETEALIGTLQFMILNKYRNDFLNEGVGFEYLSLCGKNDILITARMNKIARTMIDTVVSTRIEFEQCVFKVLLERIDFVNTDKSTPLHKTYLSKDIIDTAVSTKPYRYETHTLVGLLSGDVNLKNCVNGTSKPSFGVNGANIVEWYKFFLAYTLRDGSFLPTDPKFKSIKPPSELIGALQNLSSDRAEWRDIKTLYNVKDICNIIIGDHSYPITKQNMMKDTDLYESIIGQSKFPDSSADITAQRMIALGRMHSNRNDFYIKFSKSIPYTLPSGQIVIDDIMNVKTIPFEPDPVTKEEREFITPFYISINKDISGYCAKLDSPLNIDNWLVQMERLATYGSSGYTRKHSSDYIEMYDELVQNRDKLISKNYKIFNFGLSRLLVSFSVVFETYDNQHFALPLPAEFVDLSYSYEGDYKVLIYERYNGYILFNGNVDPIAITLLTHEYNNIINYVHSPKYITDYIKINNSSKVVARAQQQIMLAALKQQNYVVVLNDKKVAELLSIVATNFFENVHMENAKITVTVDSDATPDAKSKYIIPLLKILKYYTYYGSDVAKINVISNNILYFPKLFTFILDLYTILFANTVYPWSDPKYAKRLQRYIFFVFIDRLRKVNINTIPNLLDEMGIETYKYEQENRVFVKQITNFMKEVQRDTKYYSYNSVSRTYSFFKYRSHFIKDEDNILTSINVDKKEHISSTCAIDKFMFSYHLLDFFDLYKNKTVNPVTTYLRCQFIVKSYSDMDADSTDKHISDIVQYTIVTLSIDEIDNIVIAKDIIANTPKLLSFYDTNTNDTNPMIELPSKEKVRRYQPILKSSKEDHIRELKNYIDVVEQIREKLLITIYNYVYDHFMKMTAKLNVIGSDPNIMMLNIYEGDIDKILTVM